MNNDVLDTISKVQRYIKDHLSESITLSQLAQTANYSIPQLERLFKRALGVTPFVYIRKLRLTAAAKVLKDTDNKVIDTALDFVFDSHEGFTRAFSKEFGVPPYSYRNNPTPVKYFIAYDVIARKSHNNKKEIEKMKTVTVFTQVVERAARKAIIKRAKTASDYEDYCNEVGCDVWGVLSSVKQAQFEPAGFWLPKQLIKSGTSEYVQGVEVPANYNGVVPDGYELIDLPSCSLMVFNGEPYDDEYYEDAITAVLQAIEKFNPKTYGYEWDDSQPRFQLEPRGDRGYIEARPVKRMQSN